MCLCTFTIFPEPSTSLLRTFKSIPNTITFLNSSPLQIPSHNPNSRFPSNPKPFLPISRTQNFLLQSHRFASGITESNSASDENPTLNSPDDGGGKKPKTRRLSSRAGKKPAAPRNEAGGDAAEARAFPSTIPRKPRRERRSEAAAVEDFVRGSLERTFASMREQNRDACVEKERVFKERMSKEGDDSDISSDDDDDDDWGGGEESKQTVVEEESSDWPLDADVGWGIRASEYFEKHGIRNVVAEDGTEIDWEGEVDDSWVKEINCLEWESFAFHPSPMIVLVFERYQRATDNWKLLKELEKALKVYWEAKDRLPPRAVKLDINIERDLAYALKVRECPQILFLRGHKILYREKGFRTADDLVRMIAFFYYNAKRPSWIDEELLTY